MHILPLFRQNLSKVECMKLRCKYYRPIAIHCSKRHAPIASNSKKIKREITGLKGWVWHCMVYTNQNCLLKSIYSGIQLILMLFDDTKNWHYIIYMFCLLIFDDELIFLYAFQIVRCKGIKQRIVRVGP